MNIQRTSRLFLLGILLTLLSLVQTRAAVLQSGRAYAFSMPAEWRYASEPVATLMQQRTGVKLTLAHADSAMLKIEHDAALGSEAYTLQIADNDIVVRAASVKGVNWAMAQLAQLLSAAGGRPLECATLKSSPRFEHRGLMIDCSRHFRTIAELESMIDAMNLLRLNVLHLHLTDNQG